MCERERERECVCVEEKEGDLIEEEATEREKNLSSHHLFVIRSTGSIKKYMLVQGRATIFCGPHCAFECVSWAKFQSKRLIQCLKNDFCGPDVARGPYVAPSCACRNGLYVTKLLK